MLPMRWSRGGKPNSLRESYNYEHYVLARRLFCSCKRNFIHVLTHIGVMSHALSGPATETLV